MSGGKNVGFRRSRSRTVSFEKDGDLVVRLLSDEHRFRQRQRAEVHLEARVDARTRDDRRNAARVATGGSTEMSSAATARPPFRGAPRTTES